MSPSRKKSIWMGEPLERLIHSRRPTENDEFNVSGAINTAVARYLEMVRRHMPTLALGEWCATFDALNGLWANDAWSPTYVFVEVADSIGLGEKWAIDQEALTRTLRGLSYVECVAVLDAAERFWASDAEPGEEGWYPLVATIVGKEHVTGETR